MTERIKSKGAEKKTSHDDAKLDRGLEDSFPASDPPAVTQRQMKPGAPHEKKSEPVKKAR